MSEFAIRELLAASTIVAVTGTFAAVWLFACFMEEWKRRVAIQKQLQLATGESAKLGKDAEDLRKKYAGATAEAARMCKALSEAEARLAPLEDELAVHRRTVQMHAEEAGRHAVEKKAMADQVKNLAFSEDYWKARFQELNAAHAKLSEAYAQAQKERDSYKECCDVWVRDYGALQNEFNAYVRENKPKLDNYLNLREEITKLTAEVKDRQENADGWRVAYDAEVIKLGQVRKEAEECGKLFQKALGDCTRLELGLARVRDEANHWKNQYDSLQKGMVKSANEYQNKFQTLTQECNKLNQDVALANRDAHDARTERDSYKKLYEQAQANHTNANAKLGKLLKEVQEVRKVEESRNAFYVKLCEALSELPQHTLLGVPAAGEKVDVSIKQWLGGTLASGTATNVQAKQDKPKRVRAADDWQPSPKPGTATEYSYSDGSLTHAKWPKDLPATFVHDGLSHGGAYCQCRKCMNARVEADTEHYGYDTDAQPGCACRHCVTKRGGLPT